MGRLRMRSSPGVALLVLLMLVSAASCTTGSWVFPREYTVPVEVVDEVKAVGSVVAETRLKDGWEGNTDVVEILIVNVGAADMKQSMEVANAWLRDRGWEIHDEHPRMTFTSQRWKDVLLTLGSTDTFEMREDPQVRDFFESVEMKAEAATFLCIEIRPMT
jgi:hypothetical protein